jgi:tetratricopeptide (TPR) repeat protein
MTHHRIVLWVLLALGAGGCNRQHPHAPDAEPGTATRDGRLSPLLANLGDFERRVSTRSDMAQKYFTQGLALVYGFNHAEAVRSFQEAARNDPRLGMAYWGEALAAGPNINDTAAEEERERAAYQAARKAVEHKTGMSEVEQALIDAIAVRFSDPDGKHRQQRLEAYAAAMEQVSGRFPRDPDVATLFGAAVMDTMPWDYYEKNGKAKPATLKAVAALERAMELAPKHPGAHHYYIHAVEASPHPDRAVPSADVLGSLMPGAGHLVHMPSHIYVRVGRYSDATEANLRAIEADEDYITQCRVQGIYPAAYYPHNVHFLTASLAMEGRSAEMIAAAKKVGQHHGDDIMHQPGFGFPHLLRSIPLFTDVRFGRWDQVLAAPRPEHSAFQSAVWHYARGLAYIAQGKLAEAGRELVELRRRAAAPELQELKIFDLNSLAAIALIGVDVLEGELLAARKRYPQAIAALRRAVAREDALLYSEPPDWPIPPRHNLGAVLLAAGEARAAEQVFRQDLTRHRNNGWALLGLAQSLEAQGKDSSATRDAFRQAWAKADIQIPAARF